ncbi:ankyrin repeat domain-containing protein 35 [Rhinophrynus dorsalis]
MKRIFSCSTSQVSVDKWNKNDQKLYEAVEKGDARRVSSLLSKKLIRPTKTSPRGQSAFHLAACRGLTECVNVIISHKVEINAKTDDGCTALHLAASNCHPDCVKLLLQRGAHEDSIDFHSRTPLHCAATSGCVSSVLHLCDAVDTFLDAADDDGRTPLMIAAQRNHPTVCSLLLDRGAQIDLPDRDKKTALILACEKGNIQAAETLITKGADPTLMDHQGFDAMYYASLTRDDALRKLVQTSLDKRKSEQESNQEKRSGNKVLQKVNSREQELVNMWKRRYEEEHKRGLWLQGDLMRKTHEMENILEESNFEKIRLREMVEKLKEVLDGTTESQEVKVDDIHTSEVFVFLNRAAEQVKAIKEQQHRDQDLQEEKIRTLSDRTIEAQEAQERLHETVRCLQDEVSAAKEKEEGARRRVKELEGHLENMREVLSQFEQRKRIQSTVVEDLQEQIFEVTRENEELLILLKRLQGQEEDLDDTNSSRLSNDQHTVQDSIRVLKEFLKKLKSDCISVQTNTGGILVGRDASESHSGYVPIALLEKSADIWKKTITSMERHLVNIDKSKPNMVLDSPEKSESGPLINGTMREYEKGHKNVKANIGLYYQQLPMVETNVPCLQSEPVNENQVAKLANRTTSTSQDLKIAFTQLSKEPSRESTDNPDSLRQKILELEEELSTLKLSHDKLLSEMTQAGQEKHNLEEGLLALQERLQTEFLIRQEIDKRSLDMKQQISHLSDELLVEQDKFRKLSLRLESQHSEMLMLRDSFPPEIVREEGSKSVEMFSTDVLEELYWNVGTLVRKYNETEKQKIALQKDNQKLRDNQAQSIPITDHKNILNEMTNKLDTQCRETEELKQRLFQAMESIMELKGQLDQQATNLLSRQEHDRHIAGLERELATLKEENEACKEALEGKCEEAIVLKQLLDQELEEKQVIRSREAQGIQENERVRNALELQLQSIKEEVRVLSEKHREASAEAAHWKDLITSEREMGTRLESRVSSLEKEAEELRIKSKNCWEDNQRLHEKCEELSRTTQEKQVKVEELRKELESLAKEIEEQQRKNEALTLQLKDSNKQHQEVINIYRTHLLNAAQGFMDEDVHFSLHRILKMQNEVVY